jgi:hypothetical protein
MGKALPMALVNFELIQRLRDAAESYLRSEIKHITRIPVIMGHEVITPDNLAIATGSPRPSANGKIPTPTEASLWLDKKIALMNARVSAIENLTAIPGDAARLVKLAEICLLREDAAEMAASLASMATTASDEGAVRASAAETIAACIGSVCSDGNSDANAVARSVIAGLDQAGYVIRAGADVGRTVQAGSYRSCVR